MKSLDDSTLHSFLTEMSRTKCSHIRFIDVVITLCHFCARVYEYFWPAVQQSLVLWYVIVKAVHVPFLSTLS